MIFLIIIIALSVFFYEDAAAETAVSVKRCLENIIPSLYGSMFLACLVTRTGLHNSIGKIFSVPSRKIFRMPPGIFSVFLISNISGYPAGAKLLRNMLDEGKITREEFSRWCCFCFSSGPAFISGVSGHARISLIIFVSNFAANLAAAFLSGRKIKKQPDIISDGKCSFGCSTIIESADSTAHGMLQLCSVIMAFSVFKAVFRVSGAAGRVAELVSVTAGTEPNNSMAAVMSLLEITGISDFSGYSRTVVSLMAAIFSSGGLCVIMQIFCVAGNELDRKRFFICRLFCAVLSYIICFVLYTYFCRDIAEYASTFEFHSPDQPVTPSVILIVMSIMLISMDRERSDGKYLFIKGVKKWDLK